MPRIGHVQIAAVPKRHEPTTGSSTTRAFWGRSTSLAMPASSAANTGRRRERWKGFPGACACSVQMRAPS